MHKDERVTDAMVDAAREVCATFGQAGHLRAALPPIDMMRAALLAADEVRRAALSSPEEEKAEKVAPCAQMAGWVYDPDHPMSDGNDTRMTAAEEVLAYLLVEVNGSPDDVPYSPNEAQRILEDRLKEGRRLETDYAEFLRQRRAALITEGHP